MTFRSLTAVRSQELEYLRYNFARSQIVIGNESLECNQRAEQIEKQAETQRRRRGLPAGDIGTCDTVLTSR